MYYVWCSVTGKPFISHNQLALQEGMVNRRSYSARQVNTSARGLRDGKDRSDRERDREDMALTLDWRIAPLQNRFVRPLILSFLPSFLPCVKNRQFVYTPARHDGDGRSAIMRLSLEQMCFPTSAAVGRSAGNLS